jgi:hypothetical protein
MPRALGAASVLVGAIGFISVFVLVAVILNPLGRGFPRNCETSGDLSKLVPARNYGNTAAKSGRSSENELMQVLLQLGAAETALTSRNCLPIPLSRRFGYLLITTQIQRLRSREPEI